MNQLGHLHYFFKAISCDQRISPIHIGIYAAVLHYWQEHECVNPIQAFSYEIMGIAKISAHATYHKSIKDLNEFGYLRYEPSFKRTQGSKIYLREYT